MAPLRAWGGGGEARNRGRGRWGGLLLVLLRRVCAVRERRRGQAPAGGEGGASGAESALRVGLRLRLLPFQLVRQGGRGLGQARSRCSSEPPGAPAQVQPGGGLRPGPPRSPGQRLHARGPGRRSHGEGARPA